jgi:multimeric flavodoxin WrbA
MGRQKKMKVVALLGSPRQTGNTARLMQEVLKIAEAKGAQTQVFYLNQLTMKGCQSCFACKSQPSCIVQDGASPILEAIAEADSVVLGTPVYMWDMTAQLKNVVDRLYCFLNPDFSSKLAPGKKVLWAITQGQPDPNMFLATFEKHGKMLQMLGFGENEFLIAEGMRPGVTMSQDMIKNAHDMGEWVAAATNC